MKKLIIAAGTGFLGQVLVNHFKDKFEEIDLGAPAEQNIYRKYKKYIIHLSSSGAILLPSDCS